MKKLILFFFIFASSFVLAQESAETIVTIDSEGNRVIYENIEFYILNDDYSITFKSNDETIDYSGAYVIVK